MRLKRGLSFIMIMAMTMAGVIAVGGSEVGAAAQRPADFYRGKRIDFIIPNAPGDTSDLIARVVVKYLDKYAGTTSVIRNVREAGGAQGLRMARTAPTMAAMMLPTSTSAASIMNQCGTKRVSGDDGSAAGLLFSAGRNGARASNRKNTVNTPKNHLPSSPASQLIQVR